jgi:hypothetical protein
MVHVTAAPDVSAGVVGDLGIVVVAVVLALALGAATLRRRTA